MATYDWPTTLLPQTASIGLRKAGLQFASPFNGSRQAIDFIAERWVLSITLPPKRRRDAAPGVIESLLFRLAGGLNQARCWHFARPVPLGTMRGTPTLSATVNRGATSLAITTTAGATLKAGDMIGAGGQLFQVADDCTANGSGAISVPLVNRVRATIASGTSVVWDKPTSLFVSPSMLNSVAYRPAVLDGAAIDLEEWY